jgi:VCBS repeat-containing protein
VWDTDSSGNITTDPIGTVSGSTALEALEPSFYQDLNGDGVIGLSTAVIEVTGDRLLTLSTITQAAAIDAGATLELAGADSGSVTFNGSTGTLILEHSAMFSGQLFDFTGDGNLSSSDQIDLRDIAFGPGTTVGYAGTASSGTLTVSDTEGDTANISLAGNYTGSTFSLSSDGNGGTIVIDPADNHPAAEGTLSFSDPDPTDTHSVSVTSQNGGAGYLGSFVADAANGQDTVGWHFNFDSSPVTQTVTQSYAVTVADHHADGTTSAATQMVSVTIAGPGNDAFVFHPGVGSDTIVNAASSDIIELDGFAAVANSNQLASLLHDAQTGQAQSLFHSVNGGHDTVIDLGNHDSITLSDVQIADLHASNFIIH